MLYHGSYNKIIYNLLGSSVGCDEDGREEGGTGDEEAQGTTIRGRGCRGHVYGWRQSYAGQNFQLAISGLAQMNLKSL